jgi:NAD(P)-dependent dehydrogenase (short-subunit alcohol dehydrogenase family)
VRGLEGRVALVTGGANGIGRATAERLHAEGATVIVTDVADDVGEALVRELGERATYARHDVTSEDAWAQVAAAIRASHGRLDILVNNAGIGDGDGIEDAGLAQYERVIATSQTSVYLGLRAMGPLLHESEHGAVINVASILSFSGGFGTSTSYHAAKGAVRAMTMNLALHWAPAELFRDVTPLGRLGEPREVAGAIAFLAGDDASFITGSALVVDGGYLAR